MKKNSSESANKQSSSNPRSDFSTFSASLAMDEVIDQSNDEVKTVDDIISEGAEGSQECRIERDDDHSSNT